MARRAALVVLLMTVLMTPAPASAGGGCHHGNQAGQTEGNDPVVELSMNCFNPTVVHSPRGATVFFANRDRIPHLIEGVTWGHGELAAGERWSHEFDAAGTYPYSCRLHPGMNGVVVVGDALPIAAVAPVDDDDDDDEGWPPGPVVGAGCILVFFAFAAGRVSMRDRHAA
ncbi:MAG TPA: hypothetical protein VM030_05225 [Acidimicrobiales bacterium]|nr:hypothetical protein [Acidimicrobiales bacterium]